MKNKKKSNENGCQRKHKVNFSLIILVVALLALITLVGCTKQIAEDLPEKVLTVFKSPSCGCCGVYTQYMKRQGFEVQVNDRFDMAPIKEQYGIPPTLQSCHTSVIGGYVVEGHIPAEAIKKLLTEKPNIKGIAMPGMPPGSPGMPGAKNGPFQIYAIGNDGSITDFMTI